MVRSTDTFCRQLNNYHSNIDVYNSRGHFCACKLVHNFAVAAILCVPVALPVDIPVDVSTSSSIYM